MSTIQVTGGEIAQLIALRAAPYVVKPTHFKPSHGNLSFLFGQSDKQGMIKGFAQMPGNFVVEFDVDLNEFAVDPENALSETIIAVRTITEAAQMKRHGDREAAAQVMTKMEQGT